jgi:hypothetical protein
LRPGGGLREPPTMYVRCDERDCQYVDLNRPPCPLDTAMFDDGSEQRLATHLQAQAGSRICYACLTATLGMTHEQVRRASWRLRGNAGVSIRPARCRECQRRGVTIGLAGDPGTVRVLVKPAARFDADTEPGDRTGRVIEVIAQAEGRPLCATCLAFATGLGLAETRRIVNDLRRVPEFEHGESVCGGCGRWQPGVRPSASGARADRR